MTMAKPWRKPTRKPDHDYILPGPYFFTICVDFHRPLFSDPHYRAAVMDVWKGLPAHFDGLVLDAFVVMPDHLHGIIQLGNSEDEPAPATAALSAATTLDGDSRRRAYSLSEVLNSLKSFSTREINFLRKSPGAPVWQYNDWDRIVRGPRSLEAIRRYIINNPLNWHRHVADRELPTGIDEDEFWERLESGNALRQAHDETQQ